MLVGFGQLISHLVTRPLGSLCAHTRIQEFLCLANTIADTFILKHKRIHGDGLGCRGMAAMRKGNEALDTQSGMKDGLVSGRIVKAGRSAFRVQDASTALSGKSGPLSQQRRPCHAGGARL